MDIFVFFYGVFFWCLLISVIGYFIYIGFGLLLKELCDFFEEYED